MIDLSQCPELERIPGKVSGVWLFKGTRLPLWTVLENIKGGASLDEIAEWFEVDRAKVEAVLEFLARAAEQPLPVEEPAASR